MGRDVGFLRVFDSMVSGCSFGLSVLLELWQVYGFFSSKGFCGMKIIVNIVCEEWAHN